MHGNSFDSCSRRLSIANLGLYTLTCQSCCQRGTCAISRTLSYKLFVLSFIIAHEPISKRPLLPNMCVPAERDLSTGSNFNPQNPQCIPVVNPDMSGSPSLILNPDVIGKHFETASHDSVFEWVIVWYYRHKYCVTNEKCDK